MLMIESNECYQHDLKSNESYSSLIAVKPKLNGVNFWVVRMWNARVKWKF